MPSTAPSNPAATLCGRVSARGAPAPHRDSSPADTQVVYGGKGAQGQAHLEHAADLGPLGGAEVLARAGLGGDRLEVDAAVLVVGVEGSKHVV